MKLDALSITHLNVMFECTFETGFVFVYLFVWSLATQLVCLFATHLPFGNLSAGLKLGFSRLTSSFGGLLSVRPSLLMIIIVIVDPYLLSPFLQPLQHFPSRP